MLLTFLSLGSLTMAILPLCTLSLTSFGTLGLSLNGRFFCSSFGITRGFEGLAFRSAAWSTGQTFLYNADSLFIFIYLFIFVCTAPTHTLSAFIHHCPVFLNNDVTDDDDRDKKKTTGPSAFSRVA